MKKSLWGFEAWALFFFTGLIPRFYKSSTVSPAEPLSLNALPERRVHGELVEPWRRVEGSNHGGCINVLGFKRPKNSKIWEKKQGGLQPGRC